MDNNASTASQPITITSSQAMCRGLLCSTIYVLALKFLRLVLSIISMTTLATISVDRFYSIIYPLSFKITLKITKLILACTWILAIVISLSFVLLQYLGDGCNLLLISSSSIIVSSCTAWYDCLLIIILFIITFLVPFVLATVMLSRTWHHIWFVDVENRRITRTQHSISTSKVSMFRLVASTCVLQSLLWLPYHISQLTLLSSPLSLASHLICLVLALAAPILKFILFITLNANFLRGCQEVLCLASRNELRGFSYIITSRAVGRNAVTCENGDVDMRTGDMMSFSVNKNNNEQTQSNLHSGLTMSVDFRFDGRGNPTPAWSPSSHATTAPAAKGIKKKQVANDLFVTDF